MGITAIALLRLRTLPVLESKSLRVVRLDDAVLLYTNADFAIEPEELSVLVRSQVGEILDTEHDDPRGIFFVPDVAPPSARTYEAVIDEIGEGGVWGPASTKLSLAAAGAAGGLGALLGSVLGQLPDAVWESVGEAARGQPGALEAASSQLRAAMAGSSQLSELANRLAGGLGPIANPAASSGMDLQALMSQVQSALASDPARAADLAERFFGDAAASGNHEDEAEDEPVVSAPAPVPPRK